MVASVGIAATAFLFTLQPGKFYFCVSNSFPPLLIISLALAFFTSQPGIPGLCQSSCLDLQTDYFTVSFLKNITQLNLTLLPSPLE